MREKLTLFLLSGLVAAFLDFSKQLELLFQIEVAVVRGIVGLWALEVVTRIGRVVVDTLDHETSLGELYQRLTSTLTSGISLYLLFASWVGGTAILDAAFKAQPYTMLGSFLKMGSAFTVALWLLLNIITFVGGSRDKAHDFLNTLWAVFQNSMAGDAQSAPKPIEKYHERQP